MKHILTFSVFAVLLAVLILSAAGNIKRVKREFGWSWAYGSFYIVPCIFFTGFTVFVGWVEYHRWLGY